MNAQGRIIGVDFTAPKPQSMTESHLARHHIKKPFPCNVCCVKTTYDFVSPDGAKHEALRQHTPCCQAMCGWICCKPRFDTIPFKSASGPDFTSKYTEKCWRYCCCFCLTACETCCTCAQQCGKKQEILDTHEAQLGTIVHPTCFETCCSCLFPGKNRILLKTKTPDGTDRYIVRSDSTLVYRKYPVTAPDSQAPIAWITINAQRAWCCGGFLCCYCCHKKTSLIEIDHQHGLPFNERAHLMALALKFDDHFLPWVGCCCNDP